MLRVLIAGSDQVFADFVAETLQSYGYVTAVVYDGDSAVELAASLSPDVFLSEDLIPGVSGIGAGRLIRLMFPSCRVILFTDCEASSEVFKRAGVEPDQFEVLSKPAEPKVLLAYLSGAVSAPNRNFLA